MTQVELSEVIENVVQDMYNMDSLPNPRLLQYYQAYKDRKIWLDFEVDFDVMDCIRNILQWNSEDFGKPVEERKPIKIYLMNYGGSADMCYAMIDVIKASKTPIYTIDIGVAASAAALIFIAGHKRFMLPNAKVVIHEGSTEISGDAVKVIDASESYKKMLKRMKQFILDNTAIPSSALNRKRNNDWQMDTDYCVENKVCDMVVTSLDDIV